MTISRRNIILLSVSAIILIAIAIIQILLTNKPTTENTQSKSEPKTITQKTIDDAELYDIGAEVKYATQTLRVNSVKTEKIINSYGEAYVADTGTKYLIVDMTVTNTTKEPLTFDSFNLLSDDGELAQSTTDVVVYGENSIRSKTLNPRVPVTGTDIFVIPEDLHTTNIGSMRGSSDQFVGVRLSF